MIYIFDLDDTLYDERQYVESGFNAVAQYASKRWGLSCYESFNQLVQLLDNQGRGRIFNDFLASHHIFTQSAVNACINTYRLHQPTLTLPDAHLHLLKQLPAPLYLVTDGHKIVQQNKVAALGIAPLFKRVFITHRFGICHAKPSTYCFEKIKKAENCEWRDMVYIGDNPAKDFVNLNKLGMKTIRIRTGVHRDVIATPGYDAHIHINTLTELPQHISRTAL